MIIVKLIGGLGNQLFQYALAKKIALSNNEDVLLDITAFEKYKLHKYSLQFFNIDENFAKNEDIELFFPKNKNIFKRIRYKIKKIILKPQIIKETNSNNLVFNKISKYSYFDGYWQSEKYFHDIRKELLEDLSITIPLKGKNLNIANKIKSTNSISLHIRRADYVTNLKTFNIHGICDLEYYQSAINYMKSKVKNIVIFVFSDDIKWAKENLKTDLEIVFVDHNNADTNYEDLRLMSLCKHNIIANSSFSWWGAWLNQNPGKIVIAPKKWFATNKRDYSEIVPKTWIKI